MRGVPRVSTRTETRRAACAWQLRVAEYMQWGLMWAAEDGTCKCRTMHLEDPQMALPSWLLNMIIDKKMPDGIKAVQKAASEFEKKFNAA